FFQAEDGIRDLIVTGVQTCALPILITGGRLGDLFGHRRLFLIGMAAFTAASLLCGLAGSPALLVTARILQGATAAAMVPQVLARSEERRVGKGWRSRWSRLWWNEEV